MASILLAVALAGAWMGQAGIASGATAIVLVAAALAGWLLNREHLLVACVVVAYVLVWLAAIGVLPSQVAWLLDALIVMVFFRSLAAAGAPGRVPLPLPLWALAAAVVVSGLAFMARGASLAMLLWGFRTYLRFPILAASLIIAPLPPVALRRFWGVLIWVGLVQIPVSVWQYTVVGPGDAAPGTFGVGGTGLQAVFLAALATTVMLRGVAAGKGIRFGDVLLGVLLLVPPIIGSALVVYLLVPACLLFGAIMLRALSARSLRSMALLTMLLVAGGALAMMFTVSTHYVDNPVGVLSSPTALLASDRGSTSTGRALGRVDQLRLAERLTFGEGLQFAVFGHGPSSASVSSAAEWLNGPLVRRPGVRYVFTAAALVLIEIGLLGIAAVVSVIVLAISSAVGLARHQVRTDLGPLVLFLGVYAFALLVGSIYANSWFLAAGALPFWTAFGLVLGTGGASMRDYGANDALATPSSMAHAQPGS